MHSGDLYSGDPRGSNPYGGDQGSGSGGNWRSASPAADRPRTGGRPAVVRGGSPRTPTDLREEARRLIEARDPDAALRAAALYLSEADRLFAEAAHKFSEAQRLADRHDAARRRLVHDIRELDQDRHNLDLRTRALDQALSDLEGREAAVRASEFELDKKSRRRAADARPAPECLDTGPRHLRPDPNKVQTPREFSRLLADFRLWRGKRPLRQIADASGGRISASTVGNILRGRTVPDRLETLDAFVVGCGGNDQDRAEFASAWRRLYMSPVDSTLTDIPPVRGEPT